jgi:hypothetical protein
MRGVKGRTIGVSIAGSLIFELPLLQGACCATSTPFENKVQKY